MKLVKAAAATLALGIALVAATAPADAFLRKKDVRAVQVVTKKAESVPDASAMATSNVSGRRTCVAIQSVTRRKKPQTRRLATTIIMPSKSVTVSKSIAR